jgi:hypothetical protein
MITVSIPRVTFSEGTEVPMLLVWLELGFCVQSGIALCI